MAAGDNDPLKAPVEADPCKTTWDIAEDLDVDHTTIVRPLKQIGKTKKLNWPQVGKIVVFRRPTFGAMATIRFSKE